jgi:integrase
VRALGNVTLAEVDQEAVNRVRRLILKPEASPATILRGVISPIRTVLNYAAAQGWCDTPRFVVPRQPQGRTIFLLPAELKRLITAAAPHLKALLAFLADTGARMSEAIELSWNDVDLSAPRVNFVRTKSGRPRMGVPLSPRTVAALASLPHRDGAVFRTDKGLPYADKGRQEGGQIKHGFRRAVTRAGLDPELTPHALRHTWASWHYAQHKDLLRLKIEGGWSSLELVERYAHLMPAGYSEAIAAFWGSLPPAAAGSDGSDRQERQWVARIEAIR